MKKRNKYKKALVTGGAGFIGSHIAGRLIEAGIETVIIDDLSMGKASNVPKGAKLIIGNILDRPVLLKAMRGADIVFHDAAKVSIRNSFRDFYADAQTNCMGTVCVLRAMAEEKVKKIIYASSMAVYGKNPLPIRESSKLEPISPYGVGKLASERYCFLMAKANHFDCVVLRYFNTYGPRQTLTPYVGVITIFVNRLLQGKPPVIFGSGRQVRDFIHVADVAEANILAMEKNINFGIFNVGTGIGTSVNKIATLLIGMINKKIKPQHASLRAGEPDDSVASTVLLRKALGFVPHNKLEDKIEELVDFIRTDK
ncbi:MAG: NAD-dependent epimerase/dehydratase family protein [Candidatus Omnitrophica bacterium]|nr:NAD-dependent epimerase/dehydratase family protein [Candidatus Omnitrophota bacterium]